ncbi:unnamed protein product, partial [Iphiclides podalirius]
MSRNKTHERQATESGETLAVIREEQFSPTASSVRIDANFKREADEGSKPPSPKCICSVPDVGEKSATDGEELRTRLKEKENALQDTFNRKLEREIELLKDKFDYILQNEQIRTSYMLCEAHRERREKIKALQTQLECKNLAGLMYVLCSERRRGKFEKMRMAQEYTEYIGALQEVLTEAQTLILKLVRGYKTASQVDGAWRKKMKNVINEFQSFVHNFAGGVPETSQYFFDLSKLIKSELPEIELSEDETTLPDEAPTIVDGDTGGQPWWDMLDGDKAPFVMFGDMAEFKAPLRRDVLKALKADKPERKGWQHYVLNDKFLKIDCPNADFIKDEYLKHLSKPGKWECCTLQLQDGESTPSRRMTQASVDIRGNMGSVLRIIASSGYGQPVTKATLLGARDSMEIASATKLREKTRYSQHGKVVLNIGNKRSSKFEHYQDINIEDVEEVETLQRQETPQLEEEEVNEGSFSVLGSIHNDSLHVIPSHVPDIDSKINYEKVCPMESCKRMQVDSFIRSLPPYMRGNPYTHFENTFEEYEACSPEELEILKQRIASKKKGATDETEYLEESPLEEWVEESNEIAVQTSQLSLSLPSCTCHKVTEEEVHGRVYNIEELLPVKRALDEINKKYFFDGNVEFNRFKVVGHDDDDVMNAMQNQRTDDKVYEIKKILQNQPSLCDIFQGYIG